LKDHNVSPDDSTMPLSLFLTALTLALYSDARDRIRILYEILQMEKDQLHQQHLDKHDVQKSHLSAGITIAQVRAMVGYLQETCQLPPDTQIIPTETKYPAQQWKRGTPKELVPWGEDNGGKSDSYLLDLFTFATILRSKSVCAWGECYHKRKFEEEDI